MKLSILSKLIVFGVVTVVVGLFHRVLVDAQRTEANFEGSMKFELTINVSEAENQRPQIEVRQIIDVSNLSDNYLSSSLDFLAPFDISGLRVELDGDPVPARIRDNNVLVDFSNLLIKGRKPRRITMYYQVEQAVFRWGSLREIYWPQFEFGDTSEQYRITIKYPSSWGDLVFSSEDKLATADRGVYREYIINTGRPLLLNIGDTDLVDLKLVNNSLAHEGDKNLLLPTLFYKTSIHNSISSVVSNIEEGIDGKKVRVDDSLRELRLSMVSKSFDADSSIALKLTKTDAQKFKVEGDATAQKIFDSVLANYSPKRNISQWVRRPVGEITQLNKQDDLDYAVTLSSLLNYHRVPARVVYGLIHLPGEESFEWHFWVIYRNSKGKWFQVDPYFEDAYNIPAFGNLDRARIPWGLLTKDVDLTLIHRDNFNLDLEEVNFNSLNSDSQRLGYLAGVESRFLIDAENEVQVQGVLGASSSLGPDHVQLISGEQISNFGKQVATFGVLWVLAAGNFLVYVHSKDGDFVKSYLSEIAASLKG